MKTLLFFAAAAVLAASAGVSLAGPNAGGTLVVHAAEPFSPRTFDCQPCDNEFVCGGIDRCEDAVTRVDEVSDFPPLVIMVYAAFPSGSSPRMQAVSWGIEYGAELVAQGPLTPFRCADLEIPDLDWPDSGTGTALAWVGPQTGLFTLIYAFGLYYYSYYGPIESTQFCATPHPAQGGDFADDSIPAELDPIADYGCLGFGMDGYRPCLAPLTGACCSPAGECTIDTAANCDVLGGLYGGDGVPCEPNPCVPVPVHETTWGRTKARYR